MIVLDTSVLIASFTNTRIQFPVLMQRLENAERMWVPTMVLFEWWRAPRLDSELAIQEALFPTDTAIEFGVQEARVAARLYRRVTRARDREIDLAIAACAIAREMPLWTLNRKDFADIPGLKLA